AAYIELKTNVDKMHSKLLESMKTPEYYELDAEFIELKTRIYEMYSQLLENMLCTTRTSGVRETLEALRLQELVDKIIAEYGNTESTAA
ncbi:hypothetical protein PFISCL1PPCAC_19462, partial [Pristionchus fissidentatus]